MNAQQKLADIYALVAYIKEHIDENPIRNENQQLDEIGKTTLAISEMLQMLEQKTGVQTNEEFGEYRRALGDITKTIYDQLVTIKSLLDDNGQKTTELYDKIEEVYTTYVGILKESSEKLELQNNRYSQEAHNLVDEVKELVSSVNGLNEKVMTKEQLQEILHTVEQQVDQIANQTQDFNVTYLKNSERLDGMIENIQTLYTHLDKTLSSVGESFQTAVSRLNILLMQANQLTGKEN